MKMAEQKGIRLETTNLFGILSLCVRLLLDIRGLLIEARNKEKELK